MARCEPKRRRRSGIARTRESEPFREGWRCEWPWQRRRKERARQAGRGWSVPVPQHQVCCFDRCAVYSDHKEGAIHAIHRLLQHLPPRIANADRPLCAYLLIAPGMRPHDPWHRIQACHHIGIGYERTLKRSSSSAVTYLMNSTWLKAATESNAAPHPDCRQDCAHLQRRAAAAMRTHSSSRRE